MSSNNDKQAAQFDLVGAAGCGALVVDTAGRIRSANQRLADMAGVPRSELIGRALESLLRLVEPGQTVGASILAVTGAAQGEGALDRGSKEELPVAIAHGPAPDGSGLPGGRLVLVFDVSRHKAADERQRALFAEVTQLSDTVIEQAVELKHYSQQLEERVRQRTQELHDANLDSIFMLAVASEAKDADTGAHVLRIQRLSAGIAGMLGLSVRAVEEIGYSSILHDVGKMQVPDEILRKPGTLTAEERTVMQEHTLSGEHILSTKPFFRSARAIVRSHHENWDGSGYPDRLAGEAVALEARIVHVADVFDALINARVYKPAWTIERALEFLREQRGKMFDPAIVDAFERFLASGPQLGDAG